MGLMVLGVIIFTFCSGALSALLQNVDQNNAEIYGKV